VGPFLTITANFFLFSFDQQTSSAKTECGSTAAAAAAATESVPIPFFLSFERDKRKIPPAAEIRMHILERGATASRFVDLFSFLKIVSCLGVLKTFDKKHLAQPNYLFSWQPCCLDLFFPVGEE
jgi:hypothetical protein